MAFPPRHDHRRRRDDRAEREEEPERRERSAGDLAGTGHQRPFVAGSNAQAFEVPGRPFDPATAEGSEELLRSVPDEEPAGDQSNEEQTE